MATTRKFVVLVLSLLLAAFGIGLQIKAAIGLAPFDALNQTLAYLFEIKVGDVVTYLQIFFVVFQVLILRKETKWTILLQVFVGALLGQFVNFFVYNVFGNLVVDSYLLNAMLLAFAAVWTPFFIGSVMVLDLVTMPIESFSMVVSERTKFSFGQIRQFADILFLVASIVITLAYSFTFTIREGTIVSALTFGPLLSVYMPIIEKLFRKWNIIK